MKRKICQLLAILICCNLLLACKKKEAPTVFPQELFITKVTKKNGLFLFSNKAEIKNEEVKNKFIQDNESLFNMDTKPIIQDEKMTFLSKDSAFFSFKDIVFSVVKNGNLFLFYSAPFLTTVPQGISPLSLRKFSYPASPFIQGQYLIKEVRVARGSYKELKISVMAYKLRKGNSHSISVQAGTMFNEFNKDVIPSLGANDTLAIQEFIILTKER